MTTVSGDESGSCRTGGSSASYSDTEYTTENSSDDSNTPYIRATGCRPMIHLASRKGISSSKRAVRSKALQILLDGVADDLATLAGFVLADGKACVGIVSDIAVETAAEPCKSVGPSENSIVSRSSKPRLPGPE